MVLSLIFYVVFCLKKDNALLIDNLNIVSSTFFIFLTALYAISHTIIIWFNLELKNVLPKYEQELFWGIRLTIYNKDYAFKQNKLLCSSFPLKLN